MPDKLQLHLIGAAADMGSRDPGCALGVWNLYYCLAEKLVDINLYSEKKSFISVPKEADGSKDFYFAKSQFDVKWYNVLYGNSLKRQESALNDIILLNEKLFQETYSMMKLISLPDKPLFLSGDHSSAMGIWRGVSKFVSESLAINSFDDVSFTSNYYKNNAYNIAKDKNITTNAKAENRYKSENQQENREGEIENKNLKTSWSVNKNQGMQSIKKIREKQQDKKNNSPGKLGLIWIDAHMDSHTMTTSHSKNIHGMPLAHLLGKGDARLSGILDGMPGAIEPQNLCLVGIRSYEEEEKSLLESLGVKIFYAEECGGSNIKSILAEAAAIVSKNTSAYGVSVDLDVFDPSEVPGTGYQEPGGIFYNNVLESFQILGSDEKFIGLEITEYNPLLDKNNMTFNLIVNIIKAFYGGR